MCLQDGLAHRGPYEGETHLDRSLRVDVGVQTGVDLHQFHGCSPACLNKALADIVSLSER